MTQRRRGRRMKAGPVRSEGLCIALVGAGIEKLR